MSFFLSHSYTPTGLLRLSGLPSSWPSACLLVCQRMGFFGLLSSRLSACLFAAVASRLPCDVRVSCWSSSSFHILYIALQCRAARTVVFMRCSSHARVVADISVRRAILFLCTSYFCFVFHEVSVPWCPHRRDEMAPPLHCRVVCARVAGLLLMPFVVPWPSPSSRFLSRVR